MPRKPLKAQRNEPGDEPVLGMEVPIELTVDALARLLAAIYGASYATRDKRFGERTVRTALREDAGQVLLTAFMAASAADEQTVTWYRAKLLELEIFPSE
jgi:hypothetical protein